MRNGFLSSIAALAAGAGLAWGQTASSPPNTQSTGVARVSEPDVQPVRGIGVGPLIPPLPVASGVGDPGVGGPIYPSPANFYPVEPSNLPQVEMTSIIQEAPHWWITADYLLWFVKSQPSNYPLLTSGTTLRGAPQSAFAARPGALGQPGTTVLAGGEDIAYNAFSGFRVTGGYFWDIERREGMELNGFMLQSRRKADNFPVDQAGTPLTARPFFNSNFFGQDALVLTAPNFQGGGGTIVSTTSQIYGGGGNYVLNLYRGGPADYNALSVDFLAGLRWVQIKEDLTVNSVSRLFTNTTAPPIFGAFPGDLGFDGQVGSIRFLTILDSFKTVNDFYGGELGLRTDLRRGRWHTKGLFKVAAGVMHSRIDVDGSTSFLRGQNAPIQGSFPGGVLATPQLIGRYQRDRFSVMPEIDLQLGYQLTSKITAYVGYNFLYMTGVIRPGEIINPMVSRFQVPADPSFGVGVPGPTIRTLFRTSDFWAQGVNFGLAFAY